MTTASICTVGDEILIGQIVDTNSSHISRALNEIGVKVMYMTSISDNHRDIITQLSHCLDITDIVIVTGGLGPTKDDITKEALKELSGSSFYVESDVQMNIVRRILEARGMPMLDSNKAQALVPDRAVVIPNELGTAPCMAFYGLGRSGNSALYSLPGVPFEALGLLPAIMADIRTRFSLDNITHFTVNTFGIPESVLAEKIKDWEESLPENVKLAYLPNSTLGVRLRLTQFGGQADFSPLVSGLKTLLGDAIYGYGDTSLQEEIGKLLRSRGKTMAAAESCTGGRISELMTSIAGCSDYYKGSVTSYSNSVKTDVLGVSPDVIAKFGAVSEQCVRQMAEGVLRKLDTDYSVATSGIAGPGGGTPDKPVGMAWTAAAGRCEDGSVAVVARKVQFRSTRAVNIERFASSALDLLRLHILKERL